MINKSKVFSLIYSLLFLAIVTLVKREDVVHVSVILLGPLAMIWVGEWFIENFGGTIIGVIAAGRASFLEGKTIPVFGWFVLVFYTVMWFMIPNFTEII